MAIIDQSRSESLKKTLSSIIKSDQNDDRSLLTKIINQNGPEITSKWNIYVSLHTWRVHSIDKIFPILRHRILAMGAYLSEADVFLETDTFSIENRWSFQRYSPVVEKRRLQVRKIVPTKQTSHTQGMTHCIKIDKINKPNQIWLKLM